ncbi:MAG TPA: PEP-CTERM sorting domain-containing protein [Phycisphaerae bacterium]|nr:PEP-CTERM sorting domain-containing protein [Phycisphaerae bacterium]
MRVGTWAVCVVAVAALAGRGYGDVLYNNDAATNAMAMASRPDSGSGEIEAADDFILATSATVTGATFTGLIVQTGQSAPVIGSVNLEFYRVFPNDSDTGRTAQVPTRTNSPADDALAERGTDSAAITVSTSTLNASLTALNSVLNGIHPSPNQTTGGEGAVTGAEVQFMATLNTAVTLGADHYFFVPQVQVTGGEFYWLSGSRPISGSGTTPITPDLQAWIRNTGLDPDWVRVGTDVVGGSTPPTFNGAFSLTGTVPEPGTAGVLGAGILWGLWRRRRG